MVCNIQELLAIMRLKGVTQEELAQKAGISRATFNRRIKNGGVDFTLSEVKRIKSALELTDEEAVKIFLCPFSLKYETKGELTTV